VDFLVSQFAHLLFNATDENMRYLFWTPKIYNLFVSTNGRLGLHFRKTCCFAESI
jgi:hypothetical protein